MEPGRRHWCRMLSKRNSSETDMPLLNLHKFNQTVRVIE